jgi:hypothetical protein
MIFDRLMRGSAKLRKPWCPGPDTEAAWIKALREFGENFSFPRRNFTSVSAGRNRDDLEERVKLALCDRFAA